MANAVSEMSERPGLSGWPEGHLKAITGPAFEEVTESAEIMLGIVKNRSDPDMRSHG